MSVEDFDSLWNYSDPENTREQFLSLLPAATEAGPAVELALLTQIARTHSLKQQFEDSHRILDQVEARLLEGDALVNARYALERGRAFRSSGDPAAAKPLFEQALQSAKEAKADFFVVDAAHMLAMVEEPSKALEYNLWAIDYAERSTDSKTKTWLSSLYNNTAWTYHEAGEFEKALELFEKAEQWYRERDIHTARMRIARWSVGRALRSLGRVEEAYARQLEVQKEWGEADASDGYVNEELAELLSLMGKPKEATEQFKIAYERLSADAWLMKNEADRMSRMKEKAGL